MTINSANVLKEEEATEVYMRQFISWLASAKLRRRQLRYLMYRTYLKNHLCQQKSHKYKLINKVVRRCSIIIDFYYYGCLIIVIGINGLPGKEGLDPEIGYSKYIIQYQLSRLWSL